MDGDVTKRAGWRDLASAAGAYSEGELAQANAAEAAATSMESAFRQRYHMPPAVVCALKSAGKVAAFRLLEIVQDDTKMAQLTVPEQVKLLCDVMDKAFGKTETAGAFAVSMTKTTPERGDLGQLHAQLEAIERNTPPPELAKARPALNNKEARPVAVSNSGSSVSTGGSARSGSAVSPSASERRRSLELAEQSTVVQLRPARNVPIAIGHG